MSVKRYSLSTADKVIQVISTMEVENMHLNNTAKKNLILMATNKKSPEEVIQELKKNMGDSLCYKNRIVWNSCILINKKFVIN